MQVRVGFGYDVHKLAEGEELWLGGKLIPSALGAVGHSDADVLIHVICDALLGAANLRDIGFHFPDTSAEYKGIDSKVLLRDVIKLLEAKGYSVGNIDCTVCLEKPKVNPHIEEMKSILAKILKVDEDAVSIKATTSEKMGFVGREEGVAAFATVLVQK
ncbi:MAG: 2-C-methyl-D-erythritol 2,4-cyclodiphosphate synthase [Flavobacteriales bacterium]|nr:2-C-methyl-D-erythritol 2,4-cyclodiphosphate synthase [Flavobacteriales bacterium]